MAEYGISGIWKNSDDEVTHFAVHEIKLKKALNPEKISKVDTIDLLENKENLAYTLVWNYKNAMWKVEQEVSVIIGENEKYLRSDPDDKITNNLSHLINYDWIL